MDGNRRIFGGGWMRFTFQLRSACLDPRRRWSLNLNLLNRLSSPLLHLVGIC